MSAPKLVIVKRMLLIQGKIRPCCHVQAVVAPQMQTLLDQYFSSEPLFKRASYAVHWPEGAIPVPAALGPALVSFMKNDACPEITVKTLMHGQMHQGSNVWEMMAFELIAKLAFDNFLALCQMASEMNGSIEFHGTIGADLSAFHADTIEEKAQVAEELAA
jgi:hypothetical protein